MRHRPILAAVALPMLAAAASGYDVWPGYDHAFTKPNNANPNLEANQDRITDNVWLTRGTLRGIYNAAQEPEYFIATSPADTLWSFGTTADIGSLTFEVWVDAVSFNPPDMVGQNMVMYLITDDIYIDVRFTSWTIGAGGGGFSYVRGVPIPAPTALALIPLAGIGALRRRR